MDLDIPAPPSGQGVPQQSARRRRQGHARLSRHLSHLDVQLRRQAERENFFLT